MECNENNRSFYLDNLKFILILFVVVSHFALKLTHVNEIKFLIYFIYIFHMPCFVFVNGYLAKRMNSGGKLKVDRIFIILWMYLIFKIGNVILEFIFQQGIDLNLFRDKAAPWYLLALSIWYLSVPVLERIKTGYLIGGSIFISLMVGYIGNFREIFSLSRVFVFFPFFIMGFCLTEKQLKAFLDRKLRIPAFALLTIVLVCIVLFWEQLSPFKEIVYGGTSYRIALREFADYGFFVRGIWYLAAILMAAAIMQLVPRRRLFFSGLGERTLQVYMLHIWVRNALEYAGFFVLIEKGPSYVIFLVLGGSIILTFLLSSKWIKKLFDLLMLPKLFRMMLKN
ncbi:MAG: acyltransferase family protein [Mobilitalea sp.]